MRATSALLKNVPVEKPPNMPPPELFFLFTVAAMCVHVCGEEGFRLVHRREGMLGNRNRMRRHFLQFLLDQLY
tara:strand:- start:295 stop:513 length:219 start_codon:yes stop_codon:yes gene_type:complete